MRRLVTVLILMTLWGVASVSVAQVGTWTRKADLPTARWGLSASAVNGIIYAIGGGNRSESLPTVEEYDPVTDAWTTKADMPTPRETLTTSVVNGMIYAIGGWQRQLLVIDHQEGFRHVVP